MNRPRLWPAVLIGAALAVWLAYTWLSPDTMRQYRTMRTGAGVVLAGILLLLWLVFFSRLRWMQRLACFAGALVFLGAAASLVRIRGVSGDLVPILEPRWSREFAPAPAAPQPAPEHTPEAAQAVARPAAPDMATPAKGSPSGHASNPPGTAPRRLPAVPRSESRRHRQRRPPRPRLVGPGPAKGLATAGRRGLVRLRGGRRRR